MLSAEHSALDGLIILKHSHSFNKKCMWKLSPAWSGPQLKSPYRGQGWRETSKHPYWLLTYWPRQNSQKVRPSLSLPNTHYFIIMEKSFAGSLRARHDGIRQVWAQVLLIGHRFQKTRMAIWKRSDLIQHSHPHGAWTLLYITLGLLKEKKGRNNGKWNRRQKTDNVYLSPQNIFR